jgi:hypothetical protein
MLSQIGRPFADLTGLVAPTESPIPIAAIKSIPFHAQRAAAEVGHHLRRETAARNVATMSRTYRAYATTLLGNYLDIRGQQMTRPDVYASERYDASQKLGEEVRASGGAGLIYDSPRRQAGVNVAAHRPRNITDIVQTDHFEITVLAT